MRTAHDAQHETHPMTTLHSLLAEDAPVVAARRAATAPYKGQAMSREAYDALLSAVPAPLGTPVALCRRMQALGGQLTEALQAAEREDENSPARRREDWLRRLAVLALLALTAYLYFTRPPEEPPARNIPRSAPAR